MGFEMFRTIKKINVGEMSTKFTKKFELTFHGKIEKTS